MIKNIRRILDGLELSEITKSILPVVTKCSDNCDISALKLVFKDMLSTDLEHITDPSELKNEQEFIEKLTESLIIFDPLDRSLVSDDSQK